MTATTRHYSDTWYTHTITEPLQWPSLSADVASDVCVIGGGFAGLATALELARAGRQVTLLEARKIAWGASGRNGGFVAAGFAEDIENVVNRCGTELATRLFGYSKLGVEFVRKIATQSKRPIITGEGMLEVWRFPDTTVNQGYVDAFNDGYSQLCEYRSSERVRKQLKTDRYHLGVYDTNAFHIHPLHYAYALAEQLASNGAKIFEDSPAIKIDRVESGVQVTTLHGMVTAKDIVLCTSAYDTNNLFPLLSRAVLPVATHVVVTGPLRDSDNPVQTTAAVADTRRAGDYYRLVDGNRLLWGGKITTRTTPPANLDNMMRETMGSVYPSLANASIDFRWSGLMGYCLHKMPLIGELQTGIWTATAFGGHGINTTAMAGQLVASAIAKGDQRWRDFSAFKPLWAGGLVGRAGVQLSYWGMQARDWFDERRP